MALNILFSALTPKEFDGVMHIKTAHEVWKALEIKHEGTNQVRETKIEMLVGQYEFFKKKEGEAVKDMAARFTTIVNRLHTLGREYPQKHQVRKMLRAMTKEWDTKVIAIEESSNLDKMLVEELIGKLLTHEARMEIDKEFNESRKKSVAFVANEDKVEDKNPSSNDEKIEQLTLIVKKLEGLAKNNKWGQKSKSSSKVVCFKCKEEGHVKESVLYFKDHKQSQGIKTKRTSTKRSGESTEERIELILPRRRGAIQVVAPIVIAMMRRSPPYVSWQMKILR